MIHLPSLRAFACDTAKALGVLTVAAVFADYRTENHRLRKAHRELYMENVALSAITSDLAEQLARAVGHPCVAEPPTFAQPVTVGEFADAMALLDSDDLTGDDLLWALGEEA